MVRAVLLDAHGTLLRLRAPAPALRSRLAERLGVEITLEQAERAIAAEIAYYRAHLAEARDDAGVAALRGRCAEVLHEALAADNVPLAVDADGMTAILLASLIFEPFPEVPAVLRELRRAGLRLVVVSNWDASLPDTLASLGLLEALDGVVTSAACGAAKPDPAIFTEGLQLAGVAPEEAIHLGDRADEDVAGAFAAGIEPVLVERDRGARERDRGARESPAGCRGVRTVGSLAELPPLLGGAAAPTP
jgi:FMN phosphatase YigB (HAD superfamily)